MTSNWAAELLLELEEMIPPAIGEHHTLFLDGDRLALELSTVRDIAMRTFYLEQHDLQRNPPEIVADIVRSLNALPV